jgi:DNA-binding MarR family transcriptional regulator
VLYELAHRDGLTASEVGRDLDMDPGYLSRLLAKLEARGLLKRSPLNGDGRRVMLALTATGREAFAPLDKAARDQMAGLLEPLSATDRGKLVRAMEPFSDCSAGAKSR